MKKYPTLLKGLLLLIFISLFIVVVYILNTPREGQVQTAASKRLFAKAHVSELLSSNAKADTWTEGLRLGSQEVILTIDSGLYKGEELYAVNYLSAYTNVDLDEDTRVIVRLDTDEAQNPYIVSIVNYDRSGVLIFLTSAFVLLLILLGGKKGFNAVLGLVFTIFSIWFLLIPLVERGFPAILASVLLVSLTTLVSLLLLNGFSKKTWIAVIGCIGGVATAGLFAYLSGLITPISGFNMAEAEELVLRASDQGLKIKGLLVSGILISALGAVMDVSLTIVSSVSELFDMNPNATMKTLFHSGLNIGRDAMGTMANTLILAFAGASLNMLILFRVYDYPYLQILNSDLMTLEIIQGLSGSIGIVLTVPLVAGLSAFFFRKRTI